MDKAKRKIAIISHSLADGGAERFSGLLGGMLHDFGHEIHNITINEKVDFEYTGALYNLGELVRNKNWVYRKLGKGFLLNRYLKQHNIDTIIDNRTRNLLIRDIITKFIFGKYEVYYMVHNFNLALYFSKSKFWNRWLYGKAKKLVCVSKAIEQNVRDRFGLTNCITIYNPVQKITILPSSQNEIESPYVLYFGRFENQQKNLLLLLEAFQLSKIYEKGIRLVLMGGGSDQRVLEDYITSQSLQNHITILPYQKNPFLIVKNAKFTALSSNYEGFPMSIIESLSLGVPVVSVDCQSGPSELIQNEYNGLLVENHNVIALANGMKRMVEDEGLYEFCKKNAVASVNHLSKSEIAKAWQNLLTV